MNDVKVYWFFVTRYFDKWGILQSSFSRRYSSRDKCIEQMKLSGLSADRKMSIIFPMKIHRQAQCNWYVIHWVDGSRNASNDFKTFAKAYKSLRKWIEEDTILAVNDVEIWQAT